MKKFSKVFRTAALLAVIVFSAASLLSCELLGDVSLEDVPNGGTLEVSNNRLNGQSMLVEVKDSRGNHVYAVHQHTIEHGYKRYFYVERDDTYTVYVVGTVHSLAASVTKGGRTTIAFNNFQ